MKNITDVSEMVSRQWSEELRDVVLPLPPEAKVVTGRPKEDAHLHFLETQFGLELKLSPDSKNVVGYNVVNKEKFTWFVLRWS